MALPSELISEFVKITKDDTPKKSETIVYGTIVESDGSKYVQLDGSELLTPISSTTNVADKERVTVMIKNHTAIVTGNITSPSARNVEVDEVSKAVMDMKIIVADKVSTKELEAETARIDELIAGNVTITGKLEAAEADIKKLTAEDVTITGKLEANEAEIKDLKAENVTITGKLEAVEADIKNLDVENLEAKYANIDFANIGEAAFKKIYADSGLIKDLVVGDGTITGELVGVTIKGDLIEGNTVVAEKLVVKGSDGLYYKLNTDGMSVEAQQTEYNSLNGSVITAKSITATKISVDDLVAFDATIGGFNITSQSIYSGVKESVGNTTRGVYLDKEGQVAFGDSKNYLKYYKDTDGTYKLAISANTISLDSGKSLTDLENTVETLESNGIYDGTVPPTAPIPEGKLWLDRGLSPFILRRWLGLDVSTDAELYKSASGDPIVISGVSTQSFDKIIGNIEPVQNGTPYTAGGGKNILPPFDLVVVAANGITYTRNSDGSVSIKGTATAASTCYLVRYTHGFIPPAGAHTISVGTAYRGTGVSIQCEYYNGSSWGANYGPLLDAYGYQTFNFVEGKTLSIYIRVNSGYTVDLTLYPQIEAGSKATDFAPYSYVAPITGRTSVSLTRCGKNLIDMAEIVPYNSNTIVEQTSDSIRVYTASDGAYRGARSPYMMFRKGVTYSLSMNLTQIVSGTLICGIRCRSNSTFLGAGKAPWSDRNAYWGSTTLSTTGRKTLYFTMTEDVEACLSLLITNVDAESGDATFSNIQLEVASAPTAYEAYNGDTFKMDFGQTVYGGTVDWNTGVLTIDKKLYTFTGAETTYSKVGTAYADQTLSSVFAFRGLSDAAYGYGKSVCSHFANSGSTHVAGNQYDGVVGVYCDGNPNSASVAYYKYFRWGDGSSTVDEFKAFLAEQYAAGTPMQIAYTIAEPITIQLASSNVYPISGTNVLHTFCDSLDVDYVASGWTIVNDTAEIERALGEAALLAQAAQDAADEVSENLERRVRLDSEGLHVGDSETNDELLFQSALIHFVIDGKRVSSIAHDYHRFGSMEIRTPSSTVGGGIVIQAVES